MTETIETARNSARRAALLADAHDLYVREVVVSYDTYNQTVAAAWEKHEVALRAAADQLQKSRDQIFTDAGFPAKAPAPPAQPAKAAAQ